jgi:hypothetical protein
VARHVLKHNSLLARAQCGEGGEGEWGELFVLGVRPMHKGVTMSRDPSYSAKKK